MSDLPRGFVWSADSPFPVDIRSIDPVIADTDEFCLAPLGDERCVLPPDHAGDHLSIHDDCWVGWR